jgi:hypothetical protein
LDLLTEIDEPVREFGEPDLDLDTEDLEYVLPPDLFLGGVLDLELALEEREGERERDGDLE